MTRLGIVLAAGESTRLPGKVLLPAMRGPVIDSAFNLLARSECTHRCAVIPLDPLSPIRSYLSVRWRPSLVATDPKGVVRAIYAAYRHMDTFDEYLVTFGDNVYAEREVADAVGYASVREVDAPNADQLDGVQWQGRVEVPSMVAREDFKPVWVDRSRHSTFKLAGWLLLDRATLERLVTASDFLVPALNAAGVQPHQVDLPWWDVGTPEAYAHYWRTPSGG